jgi:hypothetical protein
MIDHSRFEELAALAAGGHLGDDEIRDLESHAETCVQCKSAIVEFRELHHSGLPLARSRVSRSIDMILNRPDHGATERFIRRASREGIAFSSHVKESVPFRRSRLSLVTTGVGALTAMLVVLFFGSRHPNHAPPPSGEQGSTQVSRQLESLKQQNSTLEATISRQQRTLAEQQRDTEDLHAQVATLNDSANSFRRDGEQARADETQSASHSAQSIEETEARLKTQEKSLEEAKAELARLNQAHSSDYASLVADQVRISELGQQLKTAQTSLDVASQLAVADRDVRNLMGARQLHVVDVRDTDANGKTGKAFGRVFLTEGKSLIFYAFDLSNAKKVDAKQTFQVWGQQEAKTSSLRSLGFLYVDDKAQRRWALKTDDPAAVKEIDSVFVTVEPEGGAKTPSGQRILYAYLGEDNHP